LKLSVLTGMSFASRRAPRGARELKPLTLRLFFILRCRAPRGARELKRAVSSALRASLSRAPRGARELKLYGVTVCGDVKVAPHAGRVN